MYIGNASRDQNVLVNQETGAVPVAWDIVRRSILRETLEDELIMETLSCTPYRGFTSDVHVVARQVVSIIAENLR